MNLANRMSFANVLPSQIQLIFLIRLLLRALLNFFQPVKKKPDFPDPCSGRETVCGVKPTSNR